MPSLKLRTQPTLDIDGIHPPEALLSEEEEMMNDVTIDLSHATIEAEALEFDEAATMERVPHAEANGTGGVREHCFSFRLQEKSEI